MIKLVFDLNGTLIFRTRKREPKITPDYYTHKDYRVYFRPHLNKLADFLHTHKIPYIFWSTCIEANTKAYTALLKPIFTNVEGYLSQDDCSFPSVESSIHKRREVKNLEQTNMFWGKDIENVYLVDDSAVKSVSGQNYIAIKEFYGSLEDTEILNLIEKLSELIDVSGKE